jgi:electron transfer flavoprotein beta subunit
MRIIVPLRRVLDPAGIVAHRRLQRIFVNREDYIIQPADHGALEAALRIKDATEAEVIVASGQPEPDDDTLRRGLAMGADRAVYLTGEGFEDADDAVMVRVLEKVVEQLGGVDLVLAGATTLDTGQGQLGPRLAEALGWPQITEAWSVASQRVGESVNESVQAVTQSGNDPSTGSGHRHVTVETDLPAVVTIAPGALKPRYPDGARLINVYRGEGEMAEALEAWDVNDLVASTELAPIIEERGQDFPPERELGERLSGPPEEMAQALADVLQQRLRG